MNKALLVGINKYPDTPLRGCVNDILLMYKVLSQKYQFDTRYIDVLTDQEATKKRIISSLKHLTRKTKPGDTIYFHYSGHGSQVVVDDWTNTDEADGRDEILCPVDLDWNDPLKDNDLGKIFKSVPNGVKIIVVLDCCHSGTGLRNRVYSENLASDIYDVKNRFLPPPISNILSNPRIDIDDHLRFILPDVDDKLVQTLKRDFMVETSKQGNAILISGCRDDQTSADAWINGRYQGALTYMLCKTLQEADYKINYKNLVKNINAKMDKLPFIQNPQLECKNEFFGIDFLT